MKKMTKLGMPIAMALFFEVSLFAIIALLLAPLGATVVASHQIALNFFCHRIYATVIYWYRGIDPNWLLLRPIAPIFPQLLPKWVYGWRCPLHYQLQS
ncbi:hypothetical protein LFREDSHE_25570 [Shewanella baltica]